MPERVLIANRGEIAVRIARTLAGLEVESVAVFAPDDAGAPHVRACDRAVALAASSASSPYLEVDALVAIARAEGCDAVHPGYGFLAERADAAAAFVAAGVTWIGPSPAAIDLLGDKIASKETAARAGVPTVPGLRGADVDAAAVEVFAGEAGLPLLLKATAGGGGKGMRRIDALADVAPAVEAARREARAAFGRGELLVERLVEGARHVEVQVALDAHGSAWAIGERECSLQRRHQKLLEESPAATLTDAERAGLHADAVRLARAAGYENLGTVEFLLDGTPAADGARPWFFLEMNARLQVEHPVTELVHGLDLVALQLRIADGEPLGADAPPPATHGHAIEARVTAERVARGPGGARFLPATGPVRAYAEPTGPGVRVDSGIEAGTAVTTSFDPLLLKVIAHGRDRAQALARLERALGDLVVLGVETNAGFLRRLLRRDEVTGDALTTTLLEELLATEAAAEDLAEPPEDDRRAALGHLVAARRAALAEAAGDGPFATPDAWRVGPPGRTWLAVQDRDERTTPLSAQVAADGEALVAVDGGDPVRVTAADVRAVATDGPWTWLHDAGGTWAFRDRPEATGGPVAAAGGLAAPLPGVVLAVRAAVGDRVAAGQVLVVLESMKMELDVAAPHAGALTALDVAVGDRVDRGQLLAAVEEDPS